jgi:hypothetical protein
MRSLPGYRVWLVLALVAVAGCAAPVRIKQGKSPLGQAQMSPDSVVLDVYFVHFPANDAEVNEELWQQIDEQHFPAALRKRLAQNGFRVGLVGGQIPATLSKLLELKDKPPPSGGATETSLIDLTTQPRVQRQHMTLRPGVHGQIVASEIYAQLPVLACEPDGLCGQTYCQAQGMLAITQYPQSDGRVRLELVPELYYDQAKQRWVGDQGAFRLEQSRPKRMFESLMVTATLAPGTMLLMTSLPNRTGSLGHHFFIEGRDQQKLLLVRLAQTQHDDLFSPTEVLPLEEAPRSR